MESTTNQIKINNSYESEPSSGSGSSLSENNDCLISDEENVHLPYLMQPQLFVKQNSIVTVNSKDNMSTIKAIPTSVAEDQKAPIIRKNSLRRFGIPLNSSEESSFEGFTGSPFGRLKHEFYADKGLNADEVPIKSQELDLSAKNIFSRFYDTIVEENSCNAVDVQLQAKDKSPSLCPLSSSKDNKADGDSLNELSFNGKIKSLKSAEGQTRKESEAMEKSQPVTLCETSSLICSKLSESFVLKKYSNERSPDIFADDDTDDQEVDNQQKNVDIETANKQMINSSTSVDDQTSEGNVAHISDRTSQHCKNFRENVRREKELLRRIRKCLAGVPPPPSLTIPQLDMFNAVLNRKNDILGFLRQPMPPQNDSGADESNSSSLFKPTHTLEVAKAMPWKEVLGVRQHGLSFNISKASESNEYLNLSVIDRFIGAETASSYTYSPSSAKKRSSRLKLLTQSPGNRLSHLAKRRAAFSSASLANTSQKSSSSLGPQILLDKRKLKNRRKGTPKRKTPGSKIKNRKTPTSSARKRLFRCDPTKPGPSRETSKRALFQSPAKKEAVVAPPPKPAIKPEIAYRVERSKRALFPPEKLSTQGLDVSISTTKPSDQLFNSSSSASLKSLQFESLLMKRKRVTADDEDDAEHSMQNAKIFRACEENLTPRALKIKSQSFSIGAGSSSTSSTSIYNAGTTGSGVAAVGTSALSRADNNSFNKMQRAHSDMSALQTNHLTDNQRKKLLWAVSQALQEKKITLSHESFKQYASVLARVVRRIFQEYYQKNSTSNSETMLRLAKKYVFNVITGKTADDIYFQAKAQIDEHKRQSNSRLSGYIGPEEYEQRKNSQLLLSQSHSGRLGGSMQNLFSIENSIDSFSLSISQASSFFGAAATSTTSDDVGSACDISISQSSSFFGQISQGTEDMQLHPNLLIKNATVLSQAQAQQQSVQPNPSLQNSSSKNNLGGVALRENVDCEQRRSAQKNFTGKDQRNVSPYAIALGIGTVTNAASSISSNGVSSTLKSQTQKQQLSDQRAPPGAKVKRHITFDN